MTRISHADSYLKTLRCRSRTGDLPGMIIDGAVILSVIDAPDGQPTEELVISFEDGAFIIVRGEMLEAAEHRHISALDHYECASLIAYNDAQDSDTRKDQAEAQGKAIRATRIDDSAIKETATLLGTNEVVATRLLNMGHDRLKRLLSINAVIAKDEDND